MSIFGNMNIQEAEVSNAVKMTPQQVTLYKSRLKKQNAGPSVHVNDRDANFPYSVFVYSKETNEFGKQFPYSFGNYENIDTAALVGTLASLFRYGANARKGVFDEAKAAADPAFKAFLEDERNEVYMVKLREMGVQL